MNQSEYTITDSKGNKATRKESRRLIAIDETKIKLDKKQIFVWAAIDVDTRILIHSLRKGI